jgi:DNA ligase (NAD+)
VDESARIAAQIELHDQLYWKQDRPEISDQAYDALVEELRRLKPDHPLLTRLQEAPPQLGLFVADTGLEARFGQTVVHEHPML